LKAKVGELESAASAIQKNYESQVKLETCNGKSLTMQIEHLKSHHCAYIESIRAEHARRAQEVLEEQTIQIQRAERKHLLRYL